jgi:hypothetical protein
MFILLSPGLLQIMALAGYLKHEDSTGQTAITTFGGVQRIHQDLTIYLADLEQEKTLTFTQEEGRRIFLFVIEGDLILNHRTFLNRRDSARITETPTLHIDLP